MTSDRSRLPLAFLLASVWNAASLPAPAEEPGGELLLATEVGTDGDFLTVEVAVAGESHAFMVDTGAHTTTLDMTFREKLIRTVPKSDIEQEYADKVGTEFYTSPRMIIRGSIHGELPFPSKLPVMVEDLSPLRDPSRHDFYGVLGMDFLQQYAVRLDPVHGRLELLDSETVKPHSTDHVLPIELHFRRPAVDVRGLRLAFDALIDTGAILTVSLGRDVHERLLDNRGFAPFHATNADGASGFSSTGRLLGVKLGPFAHYGLVANRHHATLLGLHYWRRYYCTFDFPKQKLYLRPSPYFGKHDDGDHCGMILEDETQSDRLKRVRFLISGSIAEKLGIQPGDSLVSLDGKRCSELSVSGIHLRLKLRAKGLVVLVQRDGEDLTFQIPGPKEGVPPAEVLAK